MKLKNNSSPIPPTLFEAFNKLISEEEKERIKGANGLIKCLEETEEEKVKINNRQPAKNVLRQCLLLKYSHCR